MVLALLAAGKPERLGAVLAEIGKRGGVTVELSDHTHFAADGLRVSQPVAL